MIARAANIADENRASASAFDPRASVVATGVVVVQRASRITLPWTFAFILVGLLTLAACVLVPLREENRQLAYELANLQSEADFVTRQTEANAAFVEKVHNDPALAERLVMRATRRPAAGKRFLEPVPAATFGSSPYAMTQLAPPPTPAAYESDLPPVLGSLMTDLRARAILLAAGVFLLGAGVVLGRSTPLPSPGTPGEG